MTIPTWPKARALGRKLSGWGLGLWLVACGADGRYVVIGTARAPSASGIVEVDDIGGGGTQVAVHIESLHPPSRLQDRLSHYVVWFVPTSGAPVRGGALRFDPEARTGDLTETSPFTEFEVRVTAERNSKPAAPSEFVIATQRISID
jgi:hypothetical protein